jgi:ribosomal peptide maturation radical SAM protein 1
MDEVPLPDYSDYFRRIRASSLSDEEVWLPYESARGCWWALRSVCTFCAANSQLTSFRSKSPARVLSDMEELGRRYGQRRVWFVDNILDQRYLREVFPQLKGRGAPMFLEVRAHLTKEQLRTLKEAGVVMVQPGIESLSTKILDLMKKGTNAILAVRTIKWCAELGIQVFYNFIYGFPNEPEGEYDRMSELVGSLEHLQPPNPPVQLRLDRFSSYHRDPETAGISVLGPFGLHQFIYNIVPEELSEIEQAFSFRYNDGRNPDKYAARFLASCARWRQSWQENFLRLSWHGCAKGMEIYDTRRNRPAMVYELDEIGAAVYTACDDGASPSRVWQALTEEQRQTCSVKEVEAVLQRLTALHLMMEDGGKYLALAVAGNEARLAMHRAGGTLARQLIHTNASVAL